MSKLQHNITFLQQRITNACIATNKKPENVTLLAVSKTQSVEIIQQAYDLGLRQFGENYVNEAQEKIPSLPQDIVWHFIGPLQSNKTRFIAEQVAWLHSLDREKIALRLNEQRPASLAPLQCLIQVNISNDDNKSGIDAENLLDFAAKIAALPRLQLRGLMAIPKANQSNEALAQDFAKMAELLALLQKNYTGVDTLSMGMSADLELAIAHGATIVRIGTDLFGART